MEPGSNVEMLGGPDDEGEILTPGEFAQEFLLELLGAMGTATEVEDHGESEDGSWSLEITGEDAEVLVGEQGATLHALQYLTTLVTQRRVGDTVRLHLDAAGYRGRRQKDLEEMARTVAAAVAENGQEAELDPLNAYERLLIHNALADHPDVRTYSEGQEPDRRVIIAPRGAEDEAQDEEA